MRTDQYAYQQATRVAGLGLVLAWHRIGYRARILDGSSVLFGIFLSHWVSTARERADLGSGALRLGLSIEWSLISGYFLVFSTMWASFAGLDMTTSVLDT